MSMTRDSALARRNARMLTVSLAVVAAMVGLSFASVPLYNVFCRVTGFGGTPQVVAGGAAPDSGAVQDRDLDIRFVTGTAPGLPWRFEATANTDTIRIGQGSLAYFRVTNPGDQDLSGTAVYNVTPARAALYFVKLQCFCFEQQTIAAGRTVEFPVYYYVDPAILDDPQLEDLGQITLSYTFYPTGGEDLHQAIGDYQQSMQAAALP